MPRNYTDVCMSITSLTLIIIQMRQDNEQVIFNVDFEREIFAGTGFKPSTFRPTSSGPADFPSLRYRPPSSVLYSWPKLDCHQPLGVRLLGAVASNRLLTRARSTQSVYVQESRCAAASLTAPRFPGPPTIACYQFVPYHPNSEERKSFGKSWD